MIEKYVRLNPWKLGVGVGFSIALFIFVITLVVMIFPNENIEHTSFVEDLYGFLGYEVNLVGAVLGSLYGFFDGFGITVVAVWIYNWLL